MRALLLALAWLIATVAGTAVDGTAVAGAITGTTAAVDPDAPRGRLPDAARPVAYRLAFTILPDEARFRGHAEIDVDLKQGGSRLYIHGRDLKVAKASAEAGGRTVDVRWTQVDPTGVARLDFAKPLAPGRVTLTFDYDAPFGDSPAGLYHVKVGDSWYSWTQFESIDARAAFPSFDEPGFKTPFAVTVATRPGLKVVSNAPETGVTKEGGLERHAFAPTKPLPTYLVALVTGPFATADGAVPPGAYRPAPLPLRIVGTQAQQGKLAYALAESPRIVTLLEDYFGQPFPFPKLDQIGSPVMPGAMENAGADIYGDGILFLDRGASTRRRQDFGMVVSHELAHQWFGDLVSPAWWDDIWLNESFANWMGFRIGNAWRPELRIGVGAVAEGLAAMNTDALEVGRPIHQRIERNSQIDGTFDGITYGKGGQVIAMIAAYMSDETFQRGVRLHVARHMYGNATSDEFFQALAEAARDPRVLAAMRSFVDQQGVPTIDIRRQGDRLVATQSRYAFLGGTPPAQTWTVPLCLRAGTARSCTLLDTASATIAAPGPGALVPNAGGTGYYRFTLAPADWDALIAAAATLPPAEALATADSLWASFRAGKVGAGLLVTAAKALAAHPDSSASVTSGQRFAGFRARGLIGDAALPAYRRMMAGVYGPRLAAIGFDPAAGAHAADDPDRQKLRQDLVGLLAGEAQDAGVRAKLLAAGKAYLAGNAAAVDQAFLAAALGAVVDEGRLPAAKSLAERALASEDPVFRGAALRAVAATGDRAIADWLLALDDARLRSIERMGLIATLVSTAGTRDSTTDWLLANYDKVAASGGIFMATRLPQMLAVQCSAERADAIEARLGPEVKALGAGELEFARAVETIRHCGVLRQARSAEIAAAVSGG